MTDFSCITGRLLRFGLLCVWAVAALPVVAQRNSPFAFDDDYVFWGYPVVYLNYQAKAAYPLIDRMLQAYPPVEEIDRHRWLTLVTLDQFLHDAEYYRRDAFYSFVSGRMARMLDGMDGTVFSGVRVYKLYGSGFILRTRNTTVAIDLVPGGTTSKPFLTDSVIYEIVSRCDALLITNSDGGHASRNVAKMFVDDGKTVVLPEGLWSNLGDIMPVGADTLQTHELGAMTLHVLPGHRGNARNNIYVMDFHGNGIVAHTGAQDNDNDWDWMDSVHDLYSIDVLLTKSTDNLESFLEGFRPRVVITAHENEMESAVDRRESYWEAQKRMKGVADLGIPGVIMTWGEAYDYADTDSPNISSSASKVMRNGILYIERKGALYTPAGIKVK